LLSLEGRECRKMAREVLLSLWLVAGATIAGGCHSDCARSLAVRDGRAYVASIETRSRDSRLDIEGYCQNDTTEDVVLRYELRAQKVGGSGTADSLQSGSIRVAGGQRALVSEVSLNASPADHWRIELKLYRGKELVGRDLVTCPEESESSAQRAEIESL